MKKLISLWPACCKDRSHKQHPPNNLDDSGSDAARIPITTAAVLLVVSSAGFGCVFAWQQAAHHGLVLAGLAVAMALGLEFAKPFAVESVFACLRRFAIGRAMAMALLGAVAIAYSLTAELSLMAMTRGDAVAERGVHADTAQKAKNRYQRAERAMASLAPARPASELQALVGGLLADPRVGDCTTVETPRARAACPQVAALRAEIGRAQEQARLEAAMQQAEVDGRGQQAVKVADPGAAALSTYLATFGLAIPAALVSEWLVLVGVVALELGSALSVVLVRAVDRPAPAPTLTVDTPPVESAPRAKSKAAVERAIVDTLQASGGRLSKGSVRALGSMVRATKSTTFNALAGLIASGAVVRVGNDLVLNG